MKEQARLAGCTRWNHPLLWLAAPKRLWVHQPCRETQVCRMRESRSWGSELLLSRESLSPLPPTFMKHGQSCYWNVGWTGGTPPWCGVLWTVLTWGFPTSGACTCQSTMPQSKHSLMYIVVLSIVSSKQAVTLALSCRLKWNQPWARFRCPLCPWYQNHWSQELCYVFFLLALLHTDTLNCPLSFLPHPLTRAYVLLRSNLADMIPSYCLMTCTISIWCCNMILLILLYNTHLGATHTSTSSIGGVQIPIYLVSSTTDSL